MGPVTVVEMHVRGQPSLMPAKKARLKATSAPHLLRLLPRLTLKEATELWDD